MLCSRLVYMSVADLRARLKRATNAEPAPQAHFPLRTCIDILLKLQPHLTTQFWFTLDGKEVVTESVLESEIISILERENFRIRIDEIAKELNMDKSVIVGQCTKIDSIDREGRDPAGNRYNDMTPEIIRAAIEPLLL